MSYSSAWPAVRTRIDIPCPTSSTWSSASPCDGRLRSGQSSGNQSISASGRPGRPRGNSSQNAPSIASGNANQRGSGNHHSANPLSEKRSNSGQLSSKHQAASRQAQPPQPGCNAASNVPSSDSGTTTRLHQGTATRLASGPASDAAPNSATPSGSSPTVATPWADSRSRTGRRPVSGRHHSNQATPKKLSQNPAPRIASGSNSRMAIAARASASNMDVDRRLAQTPATTAIIRTVRNVGNAKPETVAYPSAPAKPATAIATGRGHRRPSAGSSHQTADASSAAKPATRPTWNPEIAIRWVSPLARRTSQSSSDKPRVSPSASARTNREAAEGTASAMRPDMRSRQASTPRA